MALWKTYINSNFRACRLLAYARDNHRNREVRIYLVPGEWDAVGVTDGTDRWIAPVSASIFSVNIERLLQDLRAGKTLPPPKPLEAKRARLSLDDDGPTKRPRVQMDDDVQPRQRSRRVSL